MKYKSSVKTERSLTQGLPGNVFYTSGELGLKLILREALTMTSQGSLVTILEQYPKGFVTKYYPTFNLEYIQLKHLATSGRTLLRSMTPDQCDLLIVIAPNPRTSSLLEFWYELISTSHTPVIVVAEAPYSYVRNTILHSGGYVIHASENEYEDLNYTISSATELVRIKTNIRINP